jgi:carbon storage regulator
MLVLTRKAGEAVVIDGDIRVKVIAVKGHTVRLAVEAPPEVRVDRQEVHDRRIRDGFGDAEELAAFPLQVALARVNGEDHIQPGNADFL